MASKSQELLGLLTIHHEKDHKGLLRLSIKDSLQIRPQVLRSRGGGFLSLIGHVMAIRVELLLKQFAKLKQTKVS